MPIDVSFPCGGTRRLVTHGKQHTDDAVVEQPELCCRPRPILAQRWPSTGSRTEAYKVVWTGRCDWDCDSVLTRVGGSGSLWTPARAELWGRSLTGGVPKNCTGGFTRAHFPKK